MIADMITIILIALFAIEKLLPILLPSGLAVLISNAFNSAGYTT